MKILFLTQHEIQEAQIKELKKAFGENVEIKHHREAVAGPSEIMNLASDCDVIMPVCPLTWIMDLLNPRINTDKKMVIRAMMDRKLDGHDEHGNPQYSLVHNHFEIVDKFEIISHNLI